MTITVVCWLQTREGSIVMISYYSSIFFRTWWMVGIMFRIGKTNHFEKNLNWLIRNGWLNISYSGWNRLYLASGKFYVLGKRMYTISLYRYDVCMAVAGGKLRFLSGRPRDLWHVFFFFSVCVLGSNFIDIFYDCDSFGVWERFCSWRLFSSFLFQLSLV